MVLFYRYPGDCDAVNLSAADEVFSASSSGTTANTGADSCAGVVVVHSMGRTNLRMQQIPRGQVAHPVDG